jgi:hypothetical protein
MAGADALISCFDGKYHYGFWRPVHAIPRADENGNPDTAADPSCAPLLVTPNHPEYPSAHACLTQATTKTLAAFLGRDDVPSTIDSTATGTSHTFARFKDLYRYLHEARILAGIHYRFSMDDGREIGKRAARQLVRNFFRPADRDDDDDDDGDGHDDDCQR